MPWKKQRQGEKGHSNKNVIISSGSGWGTSSLKLTLYMGLQGPDTNL
uniref:Uncharacterized protein n=1 Tax=Arundo donax TaxID=35708 RepID=A0A0A9SSL5_ARUDO